MYIFSYFDNRFLHKDIIRNHGDVDEIQEGLGGAEDKQGWASQLGGSN